MRRLASGQGCCRLAVMTEFVVQDVFDKAARYPRTVEAWTQFDGARKGATVAAKPQVTQAPSGRLA
ncbi:MAG TPA: hypothetical protein DCS97_14985 [Planctomycetes bacterium]|nr:hypothetical protein [Planctomycetota bacterium]